MSFSLYYEAKRGQAISLQEQEVCEKIAEKYCDEYPFKRKIEDFGVYKIDEKTDIIFSGATKLPTTSVKTLFDIANYWLKCLTQITYTLTDCSWRVTFDDVDLVLDENEGWRFPTDEEHRT